MQSNFIQPRSHRPSCEGNRAVVGGGIGQKSSRRAVLPIKIGAMRVGSGNITRTVDTHTKALEVNLDPRRYGTFAEIGAGQEVVRWFFRVGGAAGTIAKSMSAYDMTVSDAIYGKADRYVCRQRLEAMLN